MRREKDIGLELLIAGLFAICCFSFFQFVIPYHLFQKEQTQLFLFTADYFLAYLDKPAWLARYAGDFLTQFYYLRGGGPIVLTLVLLAEWRLLVGVLRLFKPDHLTLWLALLPVAMEWVLCCQLSYSLASPLAFVGILLLFLLYVKIKNQVLSILIGLVFIPVYYSLLGAVTLVFPVLAVFYEIRNSRKIWLFWGFLGGVAAAYPSIIRSFYLLTGRQAYLYPYASIEALGTVALFIVILLLVQIKKIRTLSFNLRSLAIVVIGLFLLLTAGLRSKMDLTREKLLCLASESYFGNWDRAYDIAQKNDQQHPLISYYTNLALSRRNELPERLLEFYQPASQSLFLPVNPQSGWLTIFFSSDVYYSLGDMNMAQHAAMLGQIFSPNHRSSRLTKRLAEINLVNADTAACRKYLRLLDKTLFHRRWAVRQEALLSGVDTTDLSRLRMKRSLLPTRDTLRAATDHSTSLQLLLESHPDNRQALNYLLCYSLLNKDLSHFLTIFETYWKGKDEPLPRVYAEALLIRLASEKASEKKVKEYGIPGDIIAEFMAYTNLYEKYEGAIEPLRERFSSTFWFYYHFARMKE